MKLYAISDLHLEKDVNREALDALPAYPDDWLIVAGDLAETEARFDAGLAALTDRFARVLWVPGNHDLWTLPSVGDDGGAERLRGAAKYERLVELCRARGVLTPEDPFVRWPGAGDLVIAPTFTLYDYTFCPDDAATTAEEAVAWARESGVVCADERFLHPDPYPTRQAWCRARCRYTETRLARAADRGELVIVNHYPLREEHAVLPLIPRFTVWCGTRRTQDWHRRFGARAVVYGHLHIRYRRRVDDVRFEEVSLGYPKQWRQGRGLASYLREILPE